MQIEHIVRPPTNGRKATPVLLLHGAWHGAWCYDLWLEDFAAHGYEAHAMSLPAHGQSGQTQPLNLYGIADYVRALEHIVDQIAPNPFVVGHSMGGFVLQHYLKDHHHVSGAVLLASVPVFGVIPMLWRMVLRHPLANLRGLLTLQTRHWVGTPALASEYLLTEGAAYSAEDVASRLGGESIRAGLELAVRYRGDPRRVKTPLLVIAAERDAIFPLREQRRTAEAYGAEFLLIEGQGHNLMMERGWQQTAARIRDWFDKIVAAQE